MRVDVKKVLFVGMEADRETFFTQAQKEGLVEFINPSKLRTKEVPEEVQNLLNAIKVLRGLEPVDQFEPDDNYRQAPIFAKAILELHNRIETLREERRVLRQEIARVQPFGAFDVKALKELESEAGRVFQFFVAKKSAETEAEYTKELILVNSDHGLDYYVGINTQARSYDGLTEMYIEEPVNVLNKRFREIEAKIHETEQTLKTYANRNTYLHEALVHEMNRYELSSSRSFAEGQLNDQVFAVQGWVAQDQLPALNRLVAKHNVHWEAIAVEEEDRVPTCLENEGMARIGEDLVHIYDTPATTDKDPSPWVLWSFALFFAMIIGDGGYGLLFLIGALYLRSKLTGAKGMGKRVVTLSLILASFTLGWGLLTHSFFGINLGLEHPLRQNAPIQKLITMKADYHLKAQDEVYQHWVQKYPKLSSVDTPVEFLFGARDEVDAKVSYTMADQFYDNLMLELALFVGVLHISLSFLRNLRASWAGIGWILAMIGGYLYFPEYLNSTSLVHFALGVERAAGAVVGFDLLLGGIGVACVLALIQHRAGGATEILNVIGVFSDVLSYLRLYALGLAGAMMSSTFNEIGGSMPLVIGSVVILIGHLVNIVLSIMGGVIHGLRLNFLEWYHYCFEGGGVLFKPLSLQEVK